MGARKIIQISSDRSKDGYTIYLHALCDDGTLWFGQNNYNSAFVSLTTPTLIKWTQCSIDDIDPEGSRIEGKVI